MITKVELHVAYVWDCDDCGAENFVRAVVFEPDQEERKELDDAGLISETGYWMTRPDEVECKSCGAKFETVDTGKGDDEIE